MATSFKLSMMPIPHKKLTPERAIEWLREDGGCWVDAVCTGVFYPDNKRIRDAFWGLLNDIGVMMEACGQALSSSKSVRLERDEPGELDEPDHRLDLARIVSAFPFSERGPGDDQWAFQELGQELVARMSTAQGGA